MDDFAKDIETLQGFVGQPYNNTDQQDAEIRLFTEMMAMIIKLSKTQALPDLPNHTAEISGIEQRLDNVSKKMVQIQERSDAKKRKMEALVNKVEKLSNDLAVVLKRLNKINSSEKMTMDEIKSAVEKEVAKVFETE